MSVYGTRLAAALVVASCIVGGALECSRPAVSPSERTGAELYGRMCAVCHGPAGEGYKADRAPAIGHPAFLGSVSDDFLRKAIANGRTGTTMSAWAKTRGGPLGTDDVEALVAFLRSWEDRPRPKLDDAPLKGDPARGAVLYARECVRCHGFHGTGGQFVGIGNRELLASASDGFLRMAIRGGRAGTEMAAYDEKLSPTEVDDVIAALRKFATDAPPAPPPPPPKVPPLPLGPVPLNPHGPEPVGFKTYPDTTRAAVVKAQLDRGARMALLDARAPSDYTHEHIAGAVSVPFYDPEPYVAALPKNAWLVCYCSCPHAESGQLAQRLVAKGFKKVTVLEEGLGFWHVQNYGVREGTSP
jgi:cytochrome c oxidase cbb3-type subunit 3/ubiquinol-cytochrome c reductase cytochrome c subunit